jgi:hypothetical protein
MAGTISSIDKFHQTRIGKLIFGAAELVISDLVISRAIDTGSLWQWLIGALFFIGGINNLARVLFHKNGGAKTGAKSKTKRK